MHKLTNFTNNGRRDVALGLFEAKEDGGHNSVGFMVISRLFVMQDDDFDRVTLSDLTVNGVYDGPDFMWSFNLLYEAGFVPAR